MEITLSLPSEPQTQAVGRLLAPQLSAPLLCFFRGELGAGKTSMIRAILQSIGIQGSIKSPSYTLIEPYEIDHTHIYHMDLYRLGSPDELDWLGIRDYLHEKSICLIEWPERGAGSLPNADLEFDLSYQGDGRQLILRSQSFRGEQIIKQFMKDYERG